jgi:hypothetical protein
MTSTHDRLDRPGLTTYRGIAYDTGTNFVTGQGDLSRAAWSTEAMLSELSLISDQLNANSVTVYGSDLGRLAETAEAAVDFDLHIRLQPRLVEVPESEVLDHLAEAARLAETLRRAGANIDLTVGAVHLVFTPGLVAGEKYHHRMANVYADAEHRLLTPTAEVDVAAAAPALNAFLGRAVEVARTNFSGQVGYSAAPFEPVDWTPFDFLGLMYQYLPKALSRTEHLALIDSYRTWDKPISIAEFGTATYAEAEEKAFFFWDVVDRSGPVPLVFPEYPRDESAQAAYHLRMFEIFEEAGVAHVAVSELIHPTHPHSSDPRLDLDTASMCLVKTIRDDFSDPASTYQWEPKESFHAIADHYAHIGFQEVVRR